MKIIDVNGKERDVEYAKRISYNIIDRINNTQVPTDYIEVIINGKTGRKWKEWYPFKEFTKANPDVIYRSDE